MSFRGWNGFRSGIRKQIGGTRNSVSKMNTGTKRIHSLLTTQRLQDFDVCNPKIQAEFNLMEYKELEKYLSLQEGVEVEEK
jgi:hypothetical protein